MIRVRIELIRPGRRAEELGLIEIDNQDGDRFESDYHVRLVWWRNNGDMAVLSRMIRAFPRRRFNALGLLMRALEEIGLDEMKWRTGDEHHLER